MKEEMMIVEQSGHFVQLAKEAQERLIFLENEKKRIVAEHAALREKIQTVMEEQGIIKFENDDILITYLPESSRISFDERSFAAEMPDLHQEYMKESPVKASVRITVRKKANPA